MRYHSVVAMRLEKREGRYEFLPYCRLSEAFKNKKYVDYIVLFENFFPPFYQTVYFNYLKFVDLYFLKLSVQDFPGLTYD